MREDNRASTEPTLATLAGGGAAVGAGFGGMIGAVVGWLVGAQMVATPQIGPVVGQWVLPSALVGLLAGVGVGALVGALAAISSVRERPAVSQVGAMPLTRTTPEEDVERVIEPEESAPYAHSAPEAATLPEAAANEGEEEQPAPVPEPATEPAVEPTIEPGGAPMSMGVDAARPVVRRRRKVRISGAAGDDMTGPAMHEEMPTGQPDNPVDAGNDGPRRASATNDETPAEAASERKLEETNMSDEEKGRNSSNFTGTEDAIDPETGTLGTAGTPVTTGYGVSGSTIGTGSASQQAREESSDFRGSTPESKSYDRGGRSSSDAENLRDAERQPSVVERESDADRVEANIPRDPEVRDVYEQSEGYVESLQREPVVPPSTQGMNESAGTDIPGTGNPRGLGDNTDQS